MVDPDLLIPYVVYRLQGAEAARVALNTLLGASPYFHPLDESRRHVRGIAVEDEYAALATSIFDSHAHLRQPDDDDA